MRHKFYLPIGMSTFASEPVGPEVGDTYFDTRPAFLQVRTWDGTKWTGGADEVVVSATEPDDLNVQLWVNTSVP